MSKWTDWIPHEGDECPVCSLERIRVKFEKRTHSKKFRTGLATMFIWDTSNFPEGLPRITHYKRLKKNVEAEERENELDTTFLSGVVEGLNRNDPELHDPETPTEIQRHTETAENNASEPENTEMGITLGAEISMVYKNYRGETSHRTIRPVSLCFRSTEHHHEMQWILRAWDVDKGAERDFALRDCNFKTATESASARENFQAIVDDINSLKDRPETRRGPYVITDEDIDATTPKPVITGPGEYRMNNGKKAFVNSVGQRGAEGWFVKHKVALQCEWGLDGVSMGRKSPYYITGPWVEPEPEKPERWANLYRHEDGILHIGSTVRNSAEKVLGCRAADCVSKHIGTVLLNPGEE